MRPFLRLQRVLEHCPDQQKELGIMDEILRATTTLAQDQYGNYVVQHVLEHGKPAEKKEIITKLAGQIVAMSQHKFARWAMGPSNLGSGWDCLQAALRMGFFVLRFGMCASAIR
jgi:hypothetical protein